MQHDILNRIHLAHSLLRPLGSAPPHIGREGESVCVRMRERERARERESERQGGGGSIGGGGGGGGGS